MHHRISRISGTCFLFLAIACGNDGGTASDDAEVTQPEPQPEGGGGEGGAPGGAGSTHAGASGNPGASGEGPVEGGAGSGATSGEAGAAGGGGEGDSGGQPGSGGPSSPTDLDFAAGEVCGRAERVGTFKLDLSEDRTTFSGTITDAVVPAAVFEVLNEEGSCQLLGPRALFCDPECGSGTTCDADGSCIPTPANLTVGDLSVTGLLAPLEVSPHPITTSYSASILDPFPAFEVGSVIALDATGEGDVGPFTLEGVGIAPMTTDLGSVPIAREMPATFTWDATGADPATAAVYIDITVNPHGATTGWIECLVEDTGEFEVPASLVTQLVDLGLSGFPRASLGRRSSDGVALPAGCVDLRISSEITLDLDVDGLVSCNTNADCPDGQSCSEELACE